MMMMMNVACDEACKHFYVVAFFAVVNTAAVV